jgi:hypothetical protein
VTSGPSRRTINDISTRGGFVAQNTKTRAGKSRRNQKIKRDLYARQSPQTIDPWFLVRKSKGENKEVPSNG